jgi:hypothetical protein
MDVELLLALVGEQLTTLEAGAWLDAFAVYAKIEEALQEKEGAMTVAGVQYTRGPESAQMPLLCRHCWASTHHSNQCDTW